MGLHTIGGADVVRELILPNLKAYEKLLRDAIAEEGPRRPEAEKVLGLLLSVLSSLRHERAHLTNGHAGGVSDEVREQLAEKIGQLFADRIADAGEVHLARAILDSK